VKQLSYWMEYLAKGIKRVKDKQRVDDGPVLFFSGRGPLQKGYDLDSGGAWYTTMVCIWPVWPIRRFFGYHLIN